MTQEQSRQRKLSRNLTVDAAGFMLKTIGSCIEVQAVHSSTTATSPTAHESTLCSTASAFSSTFNNAHQSETTLATSHSHQPDEAAACARDILGSCPPHGAKAVTGKRSTMEDCYAVCPNLCELTLLPGSEPAQDKLPHRIARQLDSHPCSCSSTPPCLSDQEPSLTESVTSSEDSTMESLHFFGVYDGHGGAQAAQHCAKRLHHHLCSALASLWASHGEPCIPGDHHDPSCSDDACSAITTFTALTIADPAALQPAISEVAPPAGSWNVSRHPQQQQRRSLDACSGRSRLEAALHSAFLSTDQEFSEACSSAALVGSTAVVALVGRSHMWLANCGDSRAVLCRGGRAIQLTDDHKPEREDEAERVEKAGGQVLYYNGHRVMGVLAMSRAIGDHCLRPYVIADPEITCVSRTLEDDLMLMASDGLWDVLGNQEAVTLALRCLKRAQERGASRRASARIAANVLARAAIDRGSGDNVTVLIVDLAAYGGEEEEPAAGAAAAGQCGGGEAAA